MMSQVASSESGGNPDDYLEYNGLAVHGGTAHALWSSRIPGGGAGGVDLEALYASAAVRSIKGNNTLTITGDDGGVTNDVIVIERSQLNSDYLVVTDGDDNILYAGLMATVSSIVVESGSGNDTITINADVAAAFNIDAGSGTDTVNLVGNGTSRLLSFVYQGGDGDDDFIIDFTSGDPLPRAGFEFNFVGGAGTDDVAVIDATGTHVGWFVNTTADEVDLSLDGRPDTSSSTDDQITLRAAIQEINYSGNPGYVFLPMGEYDLTVTGTGGDDQGDLDIIGDVIITGIGAGGSIIDAGGTSGLNDRVFEISGSNRSLDLARLTITGGRVSSGSGGGLLVGAGGSLTLDQVAVVDNHVLSGGGGGLSQNNFLGASTVVINRSVFAGNSADPNGGGAIRTNGNSGSITIGQTVFAKNTATTGPNLYSTGTMSRVNQGLNLVDSNANDGGFFTTSGGSPDYIGTVHYVVTSVVDAFNATPINRALTLREAIDSANDNDSTLQEIWLPAWNFVLAIDRGTNATDTNIGYGDLDITDSLKLRGVTGFTSVEWRPGVIDAIFDLIGDFDGNGLADSEDDGDVDGRDLLTWQRQFGEENGIGLLQSSADADDDGDVDGDDNTLRAANYNNSLEILPSVEVLLA
jgi:hypothetical protein